MVYFRFVYFTKNHHLLLSTTDTNVTKIYIHSTKRVLVLQVMDLVVDLVTQLNKWINYTIFVTDPKTTSSTSGIAEKLNGLLHIIRRDGTRRSNDRVVCSNWRIKCGSRESRCYCATCSAKLALHIQSVS